MGKGFRWGITGVAWGAISTASLAGPSALNTIPTSDVLGHREAVAGYTISGTERKIDKKYTHAHSLQVGLFNFMEAGYDSDFQGATVLNLKVSLLQEGVWKKVDKLSFAAAWQNFDGTASEPYAVAAYSVGQGRLHGGYLRSGDRHRLMLGVDYAWNENLVLMADHISSVNGYTWVGFSYNIPGIPGLATGFTFGVPNTKADGQVHFATLTYGFRF